MAEKQLEAHISEAERINLHPKPSIRAFRLEQDNSFAAARQPRAQQVPCYPLPDDSMEAPSTFWKTRFHLQRPSGSFHVSLRDCTCYMQQLQLDPHDMLASSQGARPCKPRLSGSRTARSNPRREETCLGMGKAVQPQKLHSGLKMDAIKSSKQLL